MSKFRRQTIGLALLETDWLLSSDSLRKVLNVLARRWGMRRLAITILAAAMIAWTQSVPSTVQIATVDFAAGRLIDKPQVVSSELGSNHDPVWSPDGRSLVYVSEEPGGAKRALVVRSADSGRSIRDVKLQLGFAPLVWSGDSLYGTGWSRPSGGGIYRVDAETGAAGPVYIGDGHIRVSRDGKSVFFGRPLQSGQGLALIEREIAGGKEREIMRREWFQGMAVSQNKQYIVSAGIDRATNSRTALLISVASGEVREVLRVSSDLMPSDLTDWPRGTKFWHAEWVPGGRSFLMLKRQADERQDDEVWEVPLEGKPRKLDFRLPRTTLTYRLQPGGNKIVWACTIAQH